MTTTVAPQGNPFEQLIDKVKQEAGDLLSADRVIASASISLTLKGGKLFISSSESVGPASFGTPEVEIDPLVALHVVSGGIAGLVGRVFGKKA